MTKKFRLLVMNLFGPSGIRLTSIPGDDALLKKESHVFL